MPQDEYESLKNTYRVGNEDQRFAALQGLARLESPDTTVELVAGLQDRAVRIRGLAVRLLMGRQPPDVAEHVLMALEQDTSPYVRCLSAFALGSLAKPQDYPRLARAFAEQLSYGDGQVQIGICRALCDIEEEWATQLLAHLAGCGSWTVRLIACDALMGRNSDRDFLARVLDDLDADRQYNENDYFCELVEAAFRDEGDAVDADDVVVPRTSVLRERLTGQPGGMRPSP